MARKSKLVLSISKNAMMSIVALRAQHPMTDEQFLQMLLIWHEDMTPMERKAMLTMSSHRGRRQPRQGPLVTA